MAAEEKQRDAAPHVGDPSRRNECCGPRPSSYGKVKTKDVPGLAQLLERRGTGMLGWDTYYECRVCGQSWAEIWHGYGMGGDHVLQKA